jgi:hypothetical protein
MCSYTATPSLDEFLRQFPSVKREQAIAALELARTTLLAGAAIDRIDGVAASRA